MRCKRKEQVLEFVDEIFNMHVDIVAHLMLGVIGHQSVTIPNKYDIFKKQTYTLRFQKSICS